MFINALFSVILIKRIQYLVNIGFKKDLSVSGPVVLSMSMPSFILYVSVLVAPLVAPLVLS